jgi:DNA repair protein RecO (recombination protein O)
VAADAAGTWAGRLLTLPAFLADPAGAADWAAGLRLTAHFLARDAFGAQHRPLPAARLMLADRVGALAVPPGQAG